MINIKVIKELTECQDKVKNAKLWLNQKEVITYASHKKDNPTDKSSLEKIISLYKLEDEMWLNKEVELLDLELRLKTISMIYDILLTSLKAMQNGDITLDMFIAMEDEYLKLI